MRTKIIALLLACFTVSGLAAQNYKARATSYDISDNLDLEGVAFLFGESKNLEEFENKLNDPEMQISNLDLNNDGYVDYLRVVEQYENNLHLVTVQAVLAKDVFQDVANIDVSKATSSSYNVQVIGDPYLYGPNYIIEPSYVVAPVIFAWFLRPRYVVWHSPYYWGYYPPRYHHYHCVSTYNYHRNLSVHVNIHVNSYHYSQVRRNPRADEIRRPVHRNDYGQRNPDRSFSSRNSGYTNRYDMKRSQSVSEQNKNRRPVNGNNNNSRYTNQSGGKTPAGNNNQQTKRTYENKSTTNRSTNSSYKTGQTRTSTGSTQQNRSTRTSQTRQATTYPVQNNKAFNTTRSSSSSQSVGRQTKTMQRQTSNTRATQQKATRTKSTQRSGR